MAVQSTQPWIRWLTSAFEFQRGAEDLGAAVVELVTLAGARDPEAFTLDSRCSLWLPNWAPGAWRGPPKPGPCLPRAGFVYGPGHPRVFPGYPRGPSGGAFRTPRGVLGAAHQHVLKTYLTPRPCQHLGIVYVLSSTASLGYGVSLMFSPSDLAMNFRMAFT